VPRSWSTIGGSPRRLRKLDAAEKGGEESRPRRTAIANGASVTDVEQVKRSSPPPGAMGSVHILINNAGILRDKSFAKMTMDDFRLVVEVHLIGSANCTKAVWETMREQAYGRILMTSSSTGLFGNFARPITAPPSSDSPASPRLSTSKARNIISASTASPQPPPRA
jgi:NAD(P)-dependent dehydrogenase (short-subunit alcohol dehydrogenase family)